MLLNPDQIRSQILTSISQYNTLSTIPVNRLTLEQMDSLKTGSIKITLVDIYTWGYDILHPDKADFCPEDLPSIPGWTFVVDVDKEVIIAHKEMT